MSIYEIIIGKDMPPENKNTSNFIYLFILFIYLLIYLFIYFIYLFILFTYLFYLLIYLGRFF